MKSERGFGRNMLGALAAAAVLGAAASAQGLVKPGSRPRQAPGAGGSLANDMRYNPVHKTGGLARANSVDALRREITVSLHDDHLIVAGGSQDEIAALDVSFAFAGGLMAVEDLVTSGHFAADGSYAVDLSRQFPQLQFKRLHARSAKIDGKLVMLEVDLEVEPAPFATWTALDRLANPERAGAKIPAPQLPVRPGKAKPR